MEGQTEPHFGKFMHLNMLVMTGGREGTEEEFRSLYEAAGFRLTRIVPTESPFSVIEGVRAKPLGTRMSSGPFCGCGDCAFEHCRCRSRRDRMCIETRPSRNEAAQERNIPGSTCFCYAPSELKDIVDVGVYKHLAALRPVP
jgi:hypothetical protein